MFTKRGKPEPQAHIRHLELPKLETFEPEYTKLTKPSQEFGITIDWQELATRCPMSGEPDYGTVVIKYKPKFLCIELDSLDRYLWAYREVRIFHENLTNKILEDIVEAVKPSFARVETNLKTHCGNTTIIAEMV